MTSPRSNILATLAYYDVFDLPLKVEEVFARLINFRHLAIATTNLGTILYSTNITWYPSQADINKELDQLVLDGVVSRVGEFYFLFNREYLVPLRLKYEKIAKHKWHKTRRAIWWLRFVPYVEGVFASGSLAISNTNELSDLDVLVIVKHGKIWMTRLMISSILSILRMRRRGSDRFAPDKICLNHYVSDKSLKIPYKSIYNAQTYSNLVPIYIRSMAIMREFKKENAWVSDFVFNWNISNEPIIKNSWLEIIAKLVGVVLNTKIGDIFEGWAKRLQYHRISSNPLTKQSGGRVIFNDEQLEFHPHSIETLIIKKYNNNLGELGLSDLAVEEDSGLTK